MATLRSHALIDCAPDAVWKVVSDAPHISDWFPAITASTGDHKHRTVTLEGGAQLEEEVVLSDPQLRRFRYRVVGGDLSVDSHLGTIDVIDAGGGRSLVVYSTDIEPETLAETFDQAIAEALENLAASVC
ncbi:SRPBCC family protein [Streptomyces sp. Ru73]|uniref:SRPBCC family protein n=1 Tax=Streptomyces sp. Ru73 TaxID=2080748 RepID=UPI000CDD1620|nr:SRPBCC family protein [Streptomyces sp. Ru73]POX38562.1 SRPBCC family protein [Streptomyces sp. Ru73]